MNPALAAEGASPPLLRSGALRALESAWKFPNSVPQGRLSVAQDAVLGRSRNMIQSRKGRRKMTGLSAVPYGAVLAAHAYPGLTAWATLSRPCGTQFPNEVFREARKDPQR